MSCTCRIGGSSVCSFCRAQSDQAKRNADLQSQLLALAKRVMSLEETVLAQATLIQEMAAHMKGDTK